MCLFLFFVNHFLAAFDLSAFGFGDDANKDDEEDEQEDAGDGDGEDEEEEEKKDNGGFDMSAYAYGFIVMFTVLCTKVRYVFRRTAAQAQSEACAHKKAKSCLCHYRQA